MNRDYKVWAPACSRVEWTAGGQRHAMQSMEGGWWRVAAPPDAAELDYGFFLDGAGPYPDPRSPWQPHGVHGLSRPLDHSSFSWTDGKWAAPPLDSAILYELHLGTFSEAGTYNGAREKLQHLAGLGITHVELMPVHEFAGERGWGYDSADLFAPHHGYGTPDDLKRLVDRCHALGLAVVLDVVYNHLGPSGNYLSRFGPYFTSLHSNPWGAAMNFDQRGSDEVRRFFCDNALMWFRDYHMDGLRVDAVHAMFDMSACHFLEQLARETSAYGDQCGRRLALIAESDLNSPRLVQPVEVGGFGLSAAWSDDFHHSLHALLCGERDGYYEDFGSMASLAKALRDGYVYDGCYSSFRGRAHGRPAGGLSGHRFVVCSQNHDQVGNRAQGERTSLLMDAGRLKIAAAVLLLSPFVPMLFQGEEWGATSPFFYFTDYPEKELGEAVRQRRADEFSSFGWNADELPPPQALETFRKSKLRWNEIAEVAHQSLWQWYRQLIQLRQSEPRLRDGCRGEIHPVFDNEQGWFHFNRGPFLLVFNLAPGPNRIHLPFSGGKVVMASEASISADGREIELPGSSIAILKAAQ